MPRPTVLCRLSMSPLAALGANAFRVTSGVAQPSRKTEYVVGLARDGDAMCHGAVWN